MSGEAIVVVGIAIFRDGHCLVAQRSEQMSAPLRWEFPGGKVEAGEAPQAALARELKEELDVSVSVGRFIGRGTAVASGKEIVLDVYAGAIAEGTPRALEHRSLRWCSPEELEQLTWADADVPVVRKVQAALRRTAEQ